MNKNHNNEEAIKEKVTIAVDSPFKNGYNLKVHSHLDQFMVDYNIIHILKNNTRYLLWSDVRKHCLTGTWKKRPRTVTKCKSLLWLDIFLNPKNIQIYSLFLQN